jgi:integrase/recombinase XerD
MKYSDVVEGYFLDRSQSLGKATLKSYEFWFTNLEEFVGDVDFHSITTKNIIDFLQHLQKVRNLSDSTRLRAWAVLSSLWTWAEKEINAPHVLRGKIDKPTPKATAIDPLSEDEIKLLIKASQYTAEWTGRAGGKATSKRPTAKRDAAIVLTLLDCGLRASELCALTVADYDKDTGRLKIRHGKGDKERVVYLGKTAKRFIWRYLVDREDVYPKAPLFSTTTDRHLDRNNLRHMLSTIAKVASVEDVHPHRFRHTFAINFLRNGGNVFALQRLLGHERLDTVKIYVKLAQTDLEQAQRIASPADNWRL